MADNKTKVIKNASKGYGYNYSSLADMAKDGVPIPKMRVKPTEFGEYIEYFDGQEWQLGAKIVPVDMKGMNEAQAYGASVTYARRYTVQLAECVVCDDDTKLETAAPKSQGGVRYNPAVVKGGAVVDDGKTPVVQPGSVSPAQMNYIKTLLTHEYSLDEAAANAKIQELKPRLTNSKAASAMIKALQALTPLEEL